MDRRKFLIGGAVLIASPAIVRATSIMPVRPYDPLVLGVRYQSWPWDEEKPDRDYISGSTQVVDGIPKPLSEFMADSLKYFRSWDGMAFKPIYPR